MSGLEIEHLLMDVPAMSPVDARRLALLVAAGLAQTAGSAGAGDIPSIRVAVAASGPGDLDVAERLKGAGAVRPVA